MSFTETKRREIKNYILRKIDEDDNALSSKVADAFGISLTSVKRYIDSELAENHIVKSTQRECGYSLVSVKREFTYDIKALTERDDYILYKDISPLLEANENAMRIWRYALPEIFNNALEHSGGKNVRGIAEVNHLYTRITVIDDGIGIFRNVICALKEYGYSNPGPEDAVMELYKGKLTSCPQRHTGEGLFFTMRMLDRISITSDGTVMRKGYSGEPSYIRSHLIAYAMKLAKKGTVVNMQLENETRRDLTEVFNEYSSIDDGFNKTRIPVFEACMDCDPVARSQARRLCMRLDGFKEAILDFDKVDMMGQGFADEVFRIYHNEHPDVILTPVNMNDFVYRMYMHAANTKVTVPDYSKM